EQVAALLERHREVQPVPFPAREDAGFLLLVRALEAELRHVRPRGDLGLADGQNVEAVRYDLPERLARVDPGARLVHVAHLDGVADLQVSPVERLETDDAFEQRRLADAVRPDDA